jgi:hypothetical protein
MGLLLGLCFFGLAALFFYWRNELAEWNRNRTLKACERLFGNRQNKLTSRNNPTASNRPFDPIINCFKSALGLGVTCSESFWFHRVNIALSIIALVLMGVLLSISGLQSIDHTQ